MAPSPASLIRQARTSAGLSQSELARRAGIAQPVVSAYERGHRAPGIAMLSKLLEAAGHRLEIAATRAPEAPGGLPDTPLGRRLRHRRRAVLAACARRGASNVRVFGSVARGEDTDSSDIDLLVDLNEGVGIVGLIGLERELSELLGVDVDVVPAASLKHRLRGGSARDAIPL